MKCEEFNYYIASGVAAYSAFEFWIGKTKRTRANSLIEFAAIVVSMIVVRLIKGNKNEPR
jgi:hypothetical protein